ncbi:MAG: GNAT family N-acetyltransferase [SAR202 cluster bacterium]|nr:GNAT family N-acetyltransferase [SAR202 cluster bacterium]
MIKLERFEKSDIKRLLGWVHSAEELLQWSGPAYNWPLDEKQLEANLQGAMTNPPSRMIWKAVDTDTGKVFGHIELGNIDRKNRSARMSRVLVGEREYRGKGLSKEIVKQAMEIGFGEMGLHRIDLVVFDFNTPAIKLYKGLGFVDEGLHRESRAMGDGYWSLYQMSMLEGEWRAVRGKRP